MMIFSAILTANATKMPTILINTPMPKGFENVVKATFFHDENEVSINNLRARSEKTGFSWFEPKLEMPRMDVSVGHGPDESSIVFNYYSGNPNSDSWRSLSFLITMNNSNQEEKVSIRAQQNDQKQEVEVALAMMLDWQKVLGQRMILVALEKAPELKDLDFFQKARDILVDHLA
jgi:hypothetical protein